jgi:dTDP-4-dehydrorhamnose 3,5-epimerase
VKIQNSNIIIGLRTFEPIKHNDSRGWLMETINDFNLNEEFKFVQENHAFTCNAFTFRGFHHQMHPYSQTKIISCIRGKILDIIIDLRPDSETFMNAVSIELSHSNSLHLYIPKGCFHGYLTLEDNVEVIYKVDSKYNKESEVNLSPFDKSLNMVDWKGRSIKHISDKDSSGLSLREIMILLSEHE